MSTKSAAAMRALDATLAIGNQAITHQREISALAAEVVRLRANLAQAVKLLDWLQVNKGQATIAEKKIIEELRAAAKGTA